MKLQTIIGIAVALLGIVALAQIPFESRRERRQLEAGMTRAEARQDRRPVVPPLVGSIMLAGGVALIVLERRK
jgi:hypothetical protein